MIPGRESEKGKMKDERIRRKRRRKRRQREKKIKRENVPVNPIILPKLKGNLDNQETDPPSIGRPTLPELMAMFVFSVPMERGDMRANPTPAPMVKETVRKRGGGGGESKKAKKQKSKKKLKKKKEKKRNLRPFQQHKEEKVSSYGREDKTIYIDDDSNQQCQSPQLQNQALWGCCPWRERFDTRNGDHYHSRRNLQHHRG